MNMNSRYSDCRKIASSIFFLGIMLMVQKAVNASEGREVMTLQSPVSFELNSHTVQENNAVAMATFWLVLVKTAYYLTTEGCQY